MAELDGWPQAAALPLTADSVRAVRGSAVASVDRPRERLTRNGVATLSDVDLIALVLRTGSRERDASALAESILARTESVSRLGEETVSTLREVKGLGPAKAGSLLAAFELGRRSIATPLAAGTRIQNPRDVQRHFLPNLRRWKRESFHVVLLDGRHRLIAVEAVSVGTLTASLVHPREVFREAIQRAAAAVLLVHNHPSGDPSPSHEDRAVTRRLESAGELLGIRVLDHVIVADGGYFSFREEDPSFGIGESSEPYERGESSEP